MLYLERNSLQAQINTFLSILISQGGRGWGGPGLRADRRCGERTELGSSAEHSFSVCILVACKLCNRELTFPGRVVHVSFHITNHSATEREYISSYKGQSLEMEAVLEREHISNVLLNNCRISKFNQNSRTCFI